MSPSWLQLASNRFEFASGVIRGLGSNWRLDRPFAAGRDSIASQATSGCMKLEAVA